MRWLRTKRAVIALAAAILILCCCAGWVTWHAYRVRALLADLRSHDDAKVSAAIGRLSTYRSSATLRVFIDSCDGDSRYEQNLTKVFARIGPPAIPLLVEGMKHPMPMPWTIALRKMGRKGSEESAFKRTCRESICSNSLAAIGEPAVELLIETLSINDGDLQSTVVMTLKRIGAPAVGPLVRALGSADVLTRSASVEALSGIADVRAIDPIIALVRDEEEYAPARALGVGALGGFDDARAFDAIVKMLDDNNFYVRFNAVEALGRQRDPRAADHLLRIARDPVDDRRGAAIRSLSGHNEPRVIAFLVDTVAGQDASDRDDAVDVLAGMNDPRIVELLLNKLKGLSGPSRQSVAVALEAVGGDKARAAVDRELAGADLGEVARAYASFIERGDPSTEWLLAVALYRYGTVGMARDYSSCGRDMLSSAASTWKNIHKVHRAEEILLEAPRLLWGVKAMPALPVDSTASADNPGT